MTDLGISEATLSDARKGGQRVEGKLPGGTAFRGMIDTDGKLRMIRTDDGAALPEDIVRRMVPESVRNAPVYPEFSRLEGMAMHERGVMLFGADAAGETLRAQFEVDGKLRRFGRGEPEGRRGDARGKHGKMDDHGRDGDKDRKGGKNRGDDDRHKGRDRGEDGVGRHNENRDAAGQGAQTPLDDAAVRTILSDAGYTGLGAITRDGERVDIEAVNRAGQAVTVTIGPRGVVVSELAR